MNYETYYYFGVGYFVCAISFVVSHYVYSRIKYHLNKNHSPGMPEGEGSIQTNSSPSEDALGEEK